MVSTSTINLNLLIIAIKMIPTIFLGMICKKTRRILLEAANVTLLKTSELFQFTDAKQQFSIQHNIVYNSALPSCVSWPHL